MKLQIINFDFYIKTPSMILEFCQKIKLFLKHQMNAELTTQEQIDQASV